MSELRESVIVKTTTGVLNGLLFVGADRLPELVVGIPGGTEVYRPATFPATWSLRYVLQDAAPVLWAAWGAIDRIREQIVDAQREAEQEDLEASASNQAREREIDNRVAAEINHQREEASH